MNSVTIFDDYILITFNYKEGSERVSFDAIKSSDLKSVGGPCKEAYFDTMCIGICVLIFCPKPPKMAEFITLLRKAPPLALVKTRPGAVLFSLCGPWMAQTIVLLCWLSLNGEGKRPLQQGLPLNCGAIVLLLGAIVHL